MAQRQKLEIQRFLSFRQRRKSMGSQKTEVVWLDVELRKKTKLSLAVGTFAHTRCDSDNYDCRSIRENDDSFPIYAKRHTTIWIAAWQRFAKRCFTNVRKYPFNRSRIDEPQKHLAEHRRSYLPTDVFSAFACMNSLRLGRQIAWSSWNTGVSRNSSKTSSRPKQRPKLA